MPIDPRFNVFAVLLDHGYKAREKDCANMNRWRKGIITTDEMIRRFRESNDIPRTITIPENLFEEYMEKELNYRRIHD